LNWSFIGESQGRLLCDVLSKSLRQERTFEKVSAENEVLRWEVSELRTAVGSAVDRFETALKRERESFASAFDARVSELEAKMGESTSNFEGRVSSLRDEVSAFSVARCETMMQSNEIIKHTEQLLVLHPDWKIPGVLASFNANPQLNLVDKVREVR
jgi:hypothetical protein